jgi:hypothetical protein
MTLSPLQKETLSLPEELVQDGYAILHVGTILYARMRDQGGLHGPFLSSVEILDHIRRYQNDAFYRSIYGATQL